MAPLKWRRRRRSVEERIRGLLFRKYAFRNILILLAVIAICPPIYFHFRLRRLHQLELRKCRWLNNPPLVCAHGGDASKAFPNTMEAYRIALRAQVDCIEIDVSRSADGVLFALHDRDLQRISGNTSSKVGYLSAKEIKELDATHDVAIPTMEDALKLVSSSVQKVVVDAKVGPPNYEKGLAHDILSVVKRAQCKNCVIWAKSDNLARDVIKQSSDVTVGYIVMMNFTTGVRTNLLRIRDAEVVGIYHGLVDESVVKILHRRNKKVYSWTVDDQPTMEKMLNENVDAIITSDPTLLQSSMRDIRKKCLVDGSRFPSMVPAKPLEPPQEGRLVEVRLESEGADEPESELLTRTGRNERSSDNNDGNISDDGDRLSRSKEKSEKRSKVVHDKERKAY